MKNKLTKLTNIIAWQKKEIHQLTSVIYNLPGSIYWKDKKGVYLGRNSTSADSMRKHGFPWKQSDIIGKTDYDLFDKKVADRFRENDIEVMCSGQEYASEEVASLPSGEQVIQLSTKRPLWDEQGEIIGVVGNTVDITYLKQVEYELRNAKEKAEAANKAKAGFLENMRHDIRTPLVGIMGFADIIKNKATDPKIKEYADNLVSSSHALLDLLNEILEAIKVNGGEMPLLKKKFNLGKKLHEVILLNQAKASQKNIALLFEYDDNIPTYLLGDSIRIHRIVLELITNALNFTNEGHVKLSAQLAKDNENDVVVKVIVEDTGIGIKPEDQQEIYVRFKRLTPSYEGKYKGFGLGLSIVKEFVEDMQGELYVESQVGVGSTFTFISKLKKCLLHEKLGSEEEVPAFQNNKTISLVKAQHVASDIVEPLKNRILVVEDNLMAAHVITNMLSTMNCRVDVTGKGKVAVRLAQDNPYDLIFMDIGLPDIDGYEATKMIRLNGFSKKQVPIIAFTAHVDKENKKHCINVGMNAVLAKPLSQEKVEEVLDAFIPCRKDRLK